MLKLNYHLIWKNKTSVNKEDGGGGGGRADTGRYRNASMGIKYINGQFVTGHLVLRDKFLPGH